ncbi:ABC transporter ATP-binding protein [Streptomyces sp. N2-109]|uniref:ABC transporter ATP-binding protein n=1 Tax=Streptomyces gossypii TaxID=2883101 RepID=A0ABT2JVL4_9ACTN|nr:ABC transporter ATP-binding protein [Streptomyces gossypii]MCT2591938.1 ABC transporter ATP-binding protein [Streptomyces gossypii]
MTTLTKTEENVPSPTGSDAFLSVRDLHVRFSTEDGIVKAVDGLSFDLERGKTLGIVGESGSGKSVTNMSILGLHNPDQSEITGEIILDGQELTGAPEKKMEQLRGNKMAMIFQDALTALSPFYTIGRQIGEPYRKHTGASKKEAHQRAIEMLDRVGIPNPKMRVNDYPHQFSGGMRQRAMIAMSLVCNPDLLIADEPTTALDVTVQAQILDLLKDLQQEFGSAIVFITHDLGVIANVADDILVMYAGRAVERGTTKEVLTAPQHPYTWGLLSSMPRIGSDVSEGLRPIEGTPPSLLTPPPGCAFHPRCDFVDQVSGEHACGSRRPELPLGRAAACHLTAEQKRTIFVEQIKPRLG